MDFKSDLIPKKPVYKVDRRWNNKFKN